MTSVCRQDDPGFRVIVVCNDIPDLPVRSQVDFVRVDFPPPSRDTSAVTGLDAIRIDRGTKYFVGLLHAARFKPTHVMFFDADDYLSRRIAGYVNSHPGSHGWVIKDGYIYRDGSHFIQKLSDFHLWNGSCNILRFEYLDVPSDLVAPISQRDIIQRLDPFFLRGILGAHPFTDSYFDVIGKPLERFPFRGAIYVTGTGENHSGYSQAAGKERLDATLGDEFGLRLDDLDPSRLWAERAARAADKCIHAARRIRRGVRRTWSEG